MGPGGAVGAIGAGEIGDEIVDRGDPLLFQ
jgi:hypothetical protein